MTNIEYHINHRLGIKGAEMNKIAIAADHGGWEMKKSIIEYYQAKGINLNDMGTYTSDSCDYPDIAAKLCESLLKGEVETGILVCGTGIGISIAANRHKGIRAAVLYSDDVARLAREHNNANIAVFGGRTMSVEEVCRRMDIFLTTDFLGDRHLRRIEKLDK